MGPDRIQHRHLRAHGVRHIPAQRNIPRGATTTTTPGHPIGRGDSTMTVSQGYPDYSRLTPWSDAIFVNDQVVTVPNSHVYSRMFVANVRALLINFIPAGSDLSVTIRWYTDA